MGTVLLDERVFKMRMSGACFQVLGYLAARQGRNGSCYPAELTISEVTGLSLRSVKRAIAELKKLELIEITGGKRKNVYHVSCVAVANGARFGPL